MSTTGNAGSWKALCPEDLVPEIIDCVFAAWAAFKMPQPTERENPITYRLCARVRREKTKRNLPFNVEPQSDELDPETGKRIGQVDLRFVPFGQSEYVHFAIECKRLNVPFASGKKSLAGEYVNQGMMRFASGKYGAGLRTGGMLGYVMDGKTADAIKAVDQKITSEATPLCLLAPKRLSPSDAKPNDDTVRQTTHQLDKRRFTMQHIFLTV